MCLHPQPTWFTTDGFRLCVDHHSVDTPLFGNMFGRASASEAQAPKEKAKKRAYPHRDSPPREEEETSDFSVEQVTEEAPNISHPPENADMEVEQVDWEPSYPSDAKACRGIEHLRPGRCRNLSWTRRVTLRPISATNVVARHCRDARR